MDKGDIDNYAYFQEVWTSPKRYVSTRGYCSLLAPLRSMLFTVPALAHRRNESKRGRERLPSKPSAANGRITDFFLFPSAGGPPISFSALKKL